MDAKFLMYSIRQVLLDDLYIGAQPRQVTATKWMVVVIFDKRAPVVALATSQAQSLIISTAAVTSIDY